jgi:hypothetical protein
MLLVHGERADVITGDARLRPRSESDGDGAGARSWRAASKGALAAVLTGWRVR